MLMKLFRALTAVVNSSLILLLIITFCCDAAVHYATVKLGVINGLCCAMLLLVDVIELRELNQSISLYMCSDKIIKV